ncbi:cAMP-binding domain of CRP or a regulatory subunit of cAMP-dependent protein kinases [bacterium A37T11]|nr:cAMP-binding domain of CRP or a regulatory subunit of cAMP-dependent protein kinases [bacterium A37T11]
MKALPNDEYLKRLLISRYLWPSMGLDLGVTAALTKDFAALSRPIAVTRHEVLEQPGNYHSGYLYWFEQALAHTYFIQDMHKKCGLNICDWREPVVDTQALLYKEERNGFIEALEDGGALRISYPSLRALMQVYPVLREVMERLAEKQEKTYKALDEYLQCDAAKRYQQFAILHANILHRLTLEVQAMHVQVAPQYFLQYNRRMGFSRISYRTY